MSVNSDSLDRRNTAPTTVHSARSHTAIPTHRARWRHSVRCRMLGLRGRRQPATAGDTFLLNEAKEDILGDYKQVFAGSETRVFLGRAAVYERPTRRIVLHDGGSNFSGRRRCEAYHVEKAIRSVDRPGICYGIWHQ